MEFVIKKYGCIKVRSFIQSEISLKYHMFKRLNTGGELLSAQEIRNCTIRLLGSKGIDFLEECSKMKILSLLLTGLHQIKEKQDMIRNSF